MVGSRRVAGARVTPPATGVTADDVARHARMTASVLRHRVVILGGGFGGLRAALRLGSRPVDVRLVDRRNFHLFSPLLYQVATGSLSPGEIAAPLRSVLSRHANVRVLLGEAEDLDPQARVVGLAGGERLEYDSLIIATGTDTSYYGHDEWRAWAPSPKSVEATTEMRSKIFYAFEAAERAGPEAERSAWLTFIIVGAGATGLELAGALADIAHKTLRRDFRAIDPTRARIILVEAADRVLPQYPPDLSRHARRLVERLGVEVWTSTIVREVAPDAVLIERNGRPERVACKTTLWAGGIVATAFGRRVAERLGAQTDRAGRIVVGPGLNPEGFPDIFIVGDLAWRDKGNGTPLPGVAPVAIQQGEYAARVILSRLAGRATPPFRYRNRGDMAVIGRGAAVANVFGIHVWGWPAWLLWLFVHLLYLVEFQSRVVVFVHWAFLYVTSSRGARLITGRVPADP
jgi:NADH dehydrogenase